MLSELPVRFFELAAQTVEDPPTFLGAGGSVGSVACISAAAAPFRPRPVSLRPGRGQAGWGVRPGCLGGAWGVRGPPFGPFLGRRCSVSLAAGLVATGPGSGRLGGSALGTWGVPGGCLAWGVRGPPFGPFLGRRCSDSPAAGLVATGLGSGRLGRPPWVPGGSAAAGGPWGAIQAPAGLLFSGGNFPSCAHDLATGSDQGLSPHARGMDEFGRIRTFGRPPFARGLAHVPGTGAAACAPPRRFRRALRRPRATLRSRAMAV